MRLNHFHILAMAIMICSPCAKVFAAEAAEPDSVAASCPGHGDDSDAVESRDSYGSWAGSDWIDNPHLTYESVPESRILATRFGWWGVSTDGSLAGVGEWFGLQPSSPFFDVDGLFSNGSPHVGLFANGSRKRGQHRGVCISTVRVFRRISTTTASFIAWDTIPCRAGGVRPLRRRSNPRRRTTCSGART